MHHLLRQLFALLALIIIIPIHGASALQSLPLPVTTVSSIGLGIWVENIAVRATGPILTVGMTPSIYQVDPFGNSTPAIVHTFQAPINSVQGLVETRPDIFYVSAGNVSNTTIQAVPGSMSVWEVDMRLVSSSFSQNMGGAKVRKVTDIPEAIMLDGMTTLSVSRGLILISDPYKGVVWRVDINTSNYTKVLEMPSMKPVAGVIPAIGVNGIEFRDNSLYFSSTGQQTVFRQPLNQDGTANGPVVSFSGGVGTLDDFALDDANNVYVSVNSTALAFMSGNGTTPKIFCGGHVSTPLPGITGAKFGRTKKDRGILYMGTTGGSGSYSTKSFTVPGGVSKIDVGASEYFDYSL